MRCFEDVKDLVVELPNEHIHVKKSEIEFGLAGDRSQFLNCVMMNKNKAKSADGCLRLKVKNSTDWDYVTLAFQDKFYFSQSADLRGLP